MVHPARLALAVFCLFAGVEGARILMFLPFGGKSMKNVFYGMGSVLSERGHEVVFFNPYKPSKPVNGIKEVVPHKLATLFAAKNFPNLFDMKKSGLQAGVKHFYKFFIHGPRIAIESEEFDQLLKEHFDAVILGPFTYAFYSIPYLMKAPFAVLTPLAYMPMISSVLGDPTLPALVPNQLMSVTEHMSFLQRVQNALVYFISLHGLIRAQRWYYDRLVAEKFGEGVVPPSIEIERNMSVLFQSSNPILDYHHPTLPGIIEVGGLHCVKSKPLPQQLQNFIGDEEFVLFSLGSVARPEDMPQKLRATVLEALGSLPFKVLLKWDTTDRAGIPANILPSKWLPQQDILGHRRCRLFISHGGFASVLESICHGVPLVTIPISTDQDSNSANAVRLGVAVLLDWDALTVESLRQAVQQALRPQVLEAVRYRRQLLQEQPVSPRRLAVHWVEHMVKHGGAPHLRSVARDLYWFQYYSLDVLAFLLVVLVLILKLIMLALTFCCSCLCRRKHPTGEVHLKGD